MGDEDMYERPEFCFYRTRAAAATATPPRRAPLPATTARAPLLAVDEAEAADLEEEEAAEAEAVAPLRVAVAK